MANDRAQFRNALRQWDALQEQERFSVPADQGACAILCSNYGMGDAASIDYQRYAFAVEAHEIADSLKYRGMHSRIFEAYALTDAEEVLADPEIVSVITIGNGNLSEAYCQGAEILDWQFVAEHATHLKTGRFIQRHCGHCAYDLSVPLGTFAMTEHSNVFAAYGRALPTEMRQEDEDAIRPVHNERRLTYGMVKSFFQKPFPTFGTYDTSREDDDKSDTDL